MGFPNRGRRDSSPESHPWSTSSAVGGFGRRIIWEHALLINTLKENETICSIFIVENAIMEKVTPQPLNESMLDHGGKKG